MPAEFVSSRNYYRPKHLAYIVSQWVCQCIFSETGAVAMKHGKWMAVKERLIIFGRMSAVVSPSRINKEAELSQR